MQDDFHLYEFDPDLYARNLYGQQHPYKTSNLPFDSVSAYKVSRLECHLEEVHRLRFLRGNVSFAHAFVQDMFLECFLL